jgi:hypothetical protein
MKRLVVLALVAACSPEQNARDVCDEGGCAPGTLTWAMNAASFNEAAVTKVAITPDEPPWFAGFWSTYLQVAERDNEDIQIGPWDEAAEHDAFVARTGVRRLDTVAASIVDSYWLRVVGLVPDPEDGAMVFTIGQRQDTRHQLDVSWFDRTGAEINDDPLTMPNKERYTFAVLDSAGARGAAVTVDDHGWPIVALSGTRIVVTTPDPDVASLTYEGTRATVFRVGQGFEPEELMNVEGVDITDIAVLDDVMAIGGTYTGAPAPPAGSASWPACSDSAPCGFVAAYDLRTRAVTWVQPIHATGTEPGGAIVRAIGVGGAQVTALVSAPNVPIDPPLGAGPLPAYLMTLAADGVAGAPAILDQTILAEAGAEIGDADIALTPSGEVILGLTFRGTVLVGPQAMNNTGAEMSSVVAELGNDLNWAWTWRVFADRSIVSTVEVRGDQVAVGGQYLGQLETGGTLQVAPVPVTAAPNGFALEFHR